jgi:tetratricopeptide (TPR) repeat protein
MNEIKITAPKLHNVIPRDRLFCILDEMAGSPVTWLSSPAGSGKTTLIASYVQSRGIPALWYRVDEADGDVASFFYYMSEAAKELGRGGKTPLPLLSPEYRFGMSAFTRQYFESLYSRMPIPVALIFDSYQDAPEDSEFHAVIKNGLSLIPVGFRAFIVSRKEVPPPLVCLKAQGMLASVGWNDIRFTVDEIREMISHRRRKPLPEETAKRVHEETQGWAAAAILMADGGKMPSIEAKTIGHASVFDYFTVEVFLRIGQRIKDFLLTTAFLPSVSADTALGLTGAGDSAQILSHLNRNHYFTDRYGDEYRYHPLFKEFLLKQAKITYDRDHLSQISLKAGQVLSEAGQVEEAIRLLLDSGAHREVLPLMVRHARTLINQGRSATLEEWTARLPENISGLAPWLFYWMGIGKLITDPRRSRPYLEKAFTMFDAHAEQTGCSLSVAAIINSIILERDDYRPLDPWITWIDENIDAHTPLPVHETEAQVSSSMVSALTWRIPWHPNIKVWLGRAVVASEQVQDPMVRYMAKGHLIECYAYMGNWREMQMMAEEFRTLMSSPHDLPLIDLAWMTRIVMIYYWLEGYFDDCLKAVHRAIRSAKKNGLFFHLGTIYVSGAILAFDMQNLDLVKDFLSRLEKTAAPEKKVFLSRFLFFRAFYQLLRDNLIEAQRDADQAVKVALQTGRHFGEVSNRLLAAYILRRRGDREEAWRQVKRVEEILEPIETTYYLYLVRLTRASLLFDESNRAQALNSLSEAFRIGRTAGYSFTLFSWWQPVEMARLCAEALAAGIEMEYAREVVSAHRLTPKGPPENLMQWPWPVSIRTLGRFDIEIKGKPLTFTGKVQKKPLALLKAIIAEGGQDVPKELLLDLLWPEAEGDAAYISFKSAVFRLRRLLGDERAIQVKGGAISLNREVVWLDIWALESLAARVEASYENVRPEDADAVKVLSSLALNFYSGTFLPYDSDPKTENCRERLRSLFMKTVERLATVLGQAGDSEHAFRFKEVALDRSKASKKLAPFPV